MQPDRVLISDVKGEPHEVELTEIAELVRIQIDPDKPGATISLDWATQMLQEWRGRNPGQFGAVLAEVVTGARPTLSRASRAAAEAEQ
jgi:hypothetical protein